MTELNAAGSTFKVNNVRAHSFELEDTTGFSAYTTGGIVTEVSQCFVTFVTLAQYVNDNEVYAVYKS